MPLPTVLLSFYRSLFILPFRGVVYNLIRAFRPSLRFKPPLPHPIDKLYGIDTSGAVFGRALRSNNAAADLYAAPYAGSQPSIIRKILYMIPDLENTTFLDLGCGKGRTLVVASEFPLQDIVGVELSPMLAALARDNAHIIRQQFPERTPITVLEQDASALLLPEGRVIIFLYNPFFKRLMQKVARIIENVLTINSDKKIYVVYANPLYGNLFDGLPRLRRIFAGNIPFEAAELGTGVPATDIDDTVIIWESLGVSMIPPHPNANAKIVPTKTGWRVRVSSHSFDNAP